MVAGSASGAVVSSAIAPPPGWARVPDTVVRKRGVKGLIRSRRCFRMAKGKGEKRREGVGARDDREAGAARRGRARDRARRGEGLTVRPDPDQATSFDRTSTTG